MEFIFVVGDQWKEKFVAFTQERWTVQNVVVSERIDTPMSCRERSEEKGRPYAGRPSTLLERVYACVLHAHVQEMLEWAAAILAFFHWRADARCILQFWASLCTLKIIDFAPVAFLVLKFARKLVIGSDWKIFQDRIHHILGRNLKIRFRGRLRWVFHYPLCLLAIWLPSSCRILFWNYNKMKS